MVKTIVCKKCKKSLVVHKNSVPDQCPHCGANLRTLFDKVFSPPKGGKI